MRASFLKLSCDGATFSTAKAHELPAALAIDFAEEPTMFIQTEPTPNPATLKFLPGRTVLASGTLDMRDPEAASQSPLAERLFAISGVSGVFFGSDFVAVTKSNGEWQQLKPAVLGAIMEHFMSGAPIVRSRQGTTGPHEEEFFA